MSASWLWRARRRSPAHVRCGVASGGRRGGGRLADRLRVLERHRARRLALAMIHALPAGAGTRRCSRRWRACRRVPALILVAFVPLALLSTGPDLRLVGGASGGRRALAERCRLIARSCVPAGAAGRRWPCWLRWPDGSPGFRRSGLRLPRGRRSASSASTGSCRFDGGPCSTAFGAYLAVEQLATALAFADPVRPRRPPAVPRGPRAAPARDGAGRDLSRLHGFPGRLVRQPARPRPGTSRARTWPWLGLLLGALACSARVLPLGAAAGRPDALRRARSGWSARRAGGRALHVAWLIGPRRRLAPRFCASPAFSPLGGLAAGRWCRLGAARAGRGRMADGHQPGSAREAGRSRATRAALAVVAGWLAVRLRWRWAFCSMFNASTPSLPSARCGRQPIRRRG